MDISPLWTVETANDWYNRVSPIRGCNYLPRSAVNMTEMWQRETYDPGTMAEELQWASDAGYTSVRVFLQYLVWEHDPEGLKERIDSFLEISSNRGLRTMMILFCDCAFSGREPYLGPQAEPVSGVHNSQWVPSPGFERMSDPDAEPGLERYVKDIVGAFRHDDRVLIWDLYNEPGNSNMGVKSLPLLDNVFKWAREMAPDQPLTSAPWMWNGFTDAASIRAMDLSDVISFHYYQAVDSLGPYLEKCESYGRPIVCTEWLRRQHGNTFESMLPVFAEKHIGWYHWGWVAGRTQTYLAWESKAGDPSPEVWQHDMLHADGTAYDPTEFRIIESYQ